MSFTDNPSQCSFVPTVPISCTSLSCVPLSDFFFVPSRGSAYEEDASSIATESLQRTLSMSSSRSPCNNGPFQLTTLSITAERAIMRSFVDCLRHAMLLWTTRLCPLGLTHLSVPYIVIQFHDCRRVLGIDLYEHGPDACSLIDCVVNVSLHAHFTPAVTSVSVRTSDHVVNLLYLHDQTPHTTSSHHNDWCSTSR